MNRGQHRFHDYILERVHDHRVDDAKLLLTESFKKQDERSFDKAYLQEQFMPEIQKLLKSEHVEEVNGIMREFGDKYKS